MTASVTDAGFVDADGECEGTNVVYNGRTYTKAIIVSNYKISVHKRKGMMNISTMKVTLDNGLLCDYYIGTCQPEGRSRYLWSVEEKGSVCGKILYDNLYEGWANLTTSTTAPMILTVETKDHKFAIATKKEEIVCGHTGYTTESEDVVILRGKPGDLPTHGSKLNPVDIDLFQETNLKFVYIERHISNKTTELYQTMVKRFCEMNRARIQHLLSLARTDPEEFAWVYMAAPGYTASKRGEVIYLIECKKVEVTIRKTVECYNDLPVHYQNSSFFLRPGNRLLVKISSPITCSLTTPVLYKLNGIWIKIGGEPYIAPAPVTLNPNPLITWTYGPLQSLEKIGLLDKTQLKTYRDSIMSTIESMAAGEVFLSRVMYGLRDPDSNLNFNRGLDTKAIVNDVSDDVISKLYGIWDTVAKNLGAILRLAILWDFSCFVISTLLNGVMLFHKYGLSYMLLTAFWGGLAKHLLYGDDTAFKRYWRRKRANQDQPLNNPPEEVPLEGIMADVREMGTQNIYPSIPARPTAPIRTDD